MILAVLTLALALPVGGAFASAADGSAVVAKKHKKCKKHKKPKRHKKCKKPKQSKSGTWDSAITLVPTTPTQFQGTVSSKLDACRNQRYVVVSYTDPTTGQVLPLSIQRTDSAGHYAVNLPKPAFPGGYTAQVEEARVTANDAPQTCTGAASPTITVTG